MLDHAVINGEATGHLEHHAHRPTNSTELTRADLATLLADEAEQDGYPRQAPMVASA